MRRLTIGVLAHVDAGKTTLLEALLYETGALRKQGRGAHGATYLDHEAIERERGITVFSKQARIQWEDLDLTLMDTPGHVDFSGETERVLSILDVAVLMVSGTDGVQSHTETMWKLLQRRHIPTFIFVNKMDIAFRTQEEILEELVERFGHGCVDFTQKDDNFWDAVTLASEELTAIALEEGDISQADIGKGILKREVIPCYFGAALKGEGLTPLLEGLRAYSGKPSYASLLKNPESTAPAALVYKIARDTNGERLTFIKMLRGTLRVKEELPGYGKVNQIRRYHGAQYTLLQEAEEGMVCGLTGLENTAAGKGLGGAKDGPEEVLVPYLSYGVVVPEGTDLGKAFHQLQELAEEEPLLQIHREEGGTLSMQLMGEVQMEILQRLVQDRFGWALSFDSRQIIYRETIRHRVEGVGHFEPLRHYAEVHLLLEPGERGSGLVFNTAVSEDVLDRNWQRLILSHLGEREHRGVLTNSPLTDLSITLVAGKAHKKHTEGGDFRQATFRALRQGLLKAESVLLEPWFAFRLEIPLDKLGRAMNDIRSMGGILGEPEVKGEGALLSGSAPAARIGDYPLVLAGYTGGRGRLHLSMKGFEPVEDQDAIVAARGYDPLADVENPGDGVFVSGGASKIVSWKEVEQYMHLPLVTRKEEGAAEEEALETKTVEKTSSPASCGGSQVLDEELLAIFQRTYGPIKQPTHTKPAMAQRVQLQKITGERAGSRKPAAPPKPRHVLIDGYNLLYAWEKEEEALGDARLRHFGNGQSSRKRKTSREGAPGGKASVGGSSYGVGQNPAERKEKGRFLTSPGELAAARERLIDILSNYHGFTGYKVTVVFDAYRVKGGIGSNAEQGGVQVLYTRENETADTCLERLSHDWIEKEDIRVVSSDGLVQSIAWGNGAYRVTAHEFIQEILQMEETIRQELAKLTR